MFVVAGCTFARLKTSKESLVPADLHTDELGDCGTLTFPTQNPYFNEILQREENESTTGIKYARGERLLPKEFYSKLVSCLTNLCVPDNRCM